MALGIYLSWYNIDSILLLLHRILIEKRRRLRHVTSHHITIRSIEWISSIIIHVLLRLLYMSNQIHHIISYHIIFNES